MYENLVVGDSSKLGRSVSTIIYTKHERDVQNYVSHNNELFWVDCSIFDISYWIMKDSEEGKCLNEMLEDINVSESHIIDFINMTALRHMDANTLKHHIEKLKIKSFQEGERNIKLQLNKLISV